MDNKILDIFMKELLFIEESHQMGFSAVINWSGWYKYVTGKEAHIVFAINSKRRCKEFGHCIYFLIRYT